MNPRFFLSIYMWGLSPLDLSCMRPGPQKRPEWRGAQGLTGGLALGSGRLAPKRRRGTRGTPRLNALVSDPVRLHSLNSSFLLFLLE